MRHTLRIAIGATIAMGACSDDEAAPELDEARYISYNALAPGALLNSGDALEDLAAAALPGAATDLVDSESGRSLLSYVVRCALPTGQTAAFPAPPGPDLVYTGLLGFAPDWVAGSLDETERRLMTGCLIGHVNAFEVEVPISVRNALVGDANIAEKTLFPSQELVAYGNFFAPASQREMFVCFGKAVAQSFGAQGGLGGALPSYLDLRICSFSEACGFTRVGACYRWPSIPAVTTSACEQQSGSFYSSCHEAPFQQQNTPAWNETVSVYLQPVHLTLLVTAYLDLLCEITGGLVC